MSVLTWLHLSDLHLKSPASKAAKTFWDDTFRTLIADISACVAAHDLQVNGVFLTGDVAFSGAREEFERAKSALDQILEAIGKGGAKEALYVVPGNHDVDCDKVSRWAMSTRSGWFAPGGKVQYQAIEEILSSPAERRILLSGLTSFASFADEYCGERAWKGALEETSPSVGDDFFVRPLQADDGGEVAVVGLNSALFSAKEHEQGRLFIGRETVLRALGTEVKQKAPDAKLTFVLMHHPFYWLADPEIRAIAPIIADKSDFLLHGHLHCPLSYLLKTPDRAIRSWATGPVYDGPWSLNSYNFGKLDLDTGDGSMFLRVRDASKGRWHADELLYEGMNGGVLSFSLEDGNGKGMRAGAGEGESE